MNSLPELKLDWATYKQAKFACEHWHYSKCMPVGKLVKIGVWENVKFIGCVIFGYGNNQFQGVKFGLKQIEICELLRVALTKHKSSVTRILKISLMILKKSNSGLRLIVSYADPEQNHNGGIYQGGNWAFIGTGGSTEAFYTESGKRVHSRLVGKGGKKNVFGKVIKTFDSDTTIKRKLEKKYKYIFALDGEMRKRIELLRKPYPKRTKQAMTLDQREQRGGGTHLSAPQLEIKRAK